MLIEDIKRITVVEEPGMDRKDKVQLIIIWGIAAILWIGGYILLRLYSAGII